MANARWARVERVVKVRRTHGAREANAKREEGTFFSSTSLDTRVSSFALSLHSPRACLYTTVKRLKKKQLSSRVLSKNCKLDKDWLAAVLGSFFCWHVYFVICFSLGNYSLYVRASPLLHQVLFNASKQVSFWHVCLSKTRPGQWELSKAMYQTDLGSD